MSARVLPVRGRSVASYAFPRNGASTRPTRAVATANVSALAHPGCYVKNQAKPDLRDRVQAAVFGYETGLGRPTKLFLS